MKKYILFTIVVLILALAGASYLVFSNLDFNKTKDIIKPNKIGLEEKDINGWNTYSDGISGISFKYPPNWEFPPLLADGEWFGDIIKIDGYEDELHVSGADYSDYTEEGPFGAFADCDIAYNNIDEFCEEGCVKINNKTAYDFRFVFHGEGSISALAYTNVSNKYPSICFELPLGEIWEKIVYNGIDYEDERGNYDVEKYMEKAKLSKNTLKEINNFVTFVNSIESR